MGEVGLACADQEAVLGIKRVWNLNASQVSTLRVSYRHCQENTPPSLCARSEEPLSEHSRVTIQTRAKGAPLVLPGPVPEVGREPVPGLRLVRLWGRKSGPSHENREEMAALQAKQKLPKSLLEELEHLNCSTSILDIKKLIKDLPLGKFSPIEFYLLVK